MEEKISKCNAVAYAVDKMMEAFDGDDDDYKNATVEMIYMLCDMVKELYMEL